MDKAFLDTVRSFDEYSFSTLQFAHAFERMHNALWLQFLEKYGRGGRGAGKKYSVYSYIAQTLNKLANAGQLEKLDYRKAPPEFGNPYVRYWAENCGYLDYPDEIRDTATIIEGAKKQIYVNKYERDRNARALCIEKHGLECVICKFNFEAVYGSVGAGFIHVHHLKPLSEIGEEYELDPVRDLRPVCPNCHAMLHRKKTTLSIAELKGNITSRPS